MPSGTQEPPKTANLRIFVKPSSVESESELPIGVQIHALQTVLHKLLHLQESYSYMPSTTSPAPIVGRRVDRD